MRILRGLGGRTLPCGCLTGVYETYDGNVVRILDERGENCRNPAHQAGHSVSEPSEPSAEHPKRG
jgi:hypothetical protein